MRNSLKNRISVSFRSECENGLNSFSNYLLGNQPCHRSIILFIYIPIWWMWAYCNKLPKRRNPLSFFFHSLEHYFFIWNIYPQYRLFQIDTEIKFEFDSKRKGFSFEWNWLSDSRYLYLATVTLYPIGWWEIVLCICTPTYSKYQFPGWSAYDKVPTEAEFLIKKINTKKKIHVRMP